MNDSCEISINSIRNWNKSLVDKMMAEDVEINSWNFISINEFATMHVFQLTKMDQQTFNYFIVLFETLDCHVALAEDTWIGFNLKQIALDSIQYPTQSTRCNRKILEMFPSITANKINELKFEFVSTAYNIDLIWLFQIPLKFVYGVCAQASVENLDTLMSKLFYIVHFALVQLSRIGKRCDFNEY